MAAKCASVARCACKKSRSGNFVFLQQEHTQKEQTQQGRVHVLVMAGRKEISFLVVSAVLSVFVGRALALMCLCAWLRAKAHQARQHVERYTVHLRGFITCMTSHVGGCAYAENEHQVSAACGVREILDNINVG